MHDRVEAAVDGEDGADERLGRASVDQVRAVDAVGAELGGEVRGR